MCNIVFSLDYVCGHSQGHQDGIPDRFYRPCTLRTRRFHGCSNREDPTPLEEAVPWYCPQCHWRLIQEALGPLHREASVVAERVMSQSGRVPEGNDSISIQVCSDDLRRATCLMTSSVQLVAVHWHQLRERVLREWLGAESFSHFARYSCDGAMPWWHAVETGRVKTNPFQRLESCPEERLPDYREPTSALVSTPNPPVDRFRGSEDVSSSQVSNVNQNPTPYHGNDWNFVSDVHRRAGWVNGPPPTVVPEIYDGVIFLSSLSSFQDLPPEDQSLPPSSRLASESYGSPTLCQSGRSDDEAEEGPSYHGERLDGSEDEPTQGTSLPWSCRSSRSDSITSSRDRPLWTGYDSSNPENYPNFEDYSASACQPLSQALAYQENAELVHSLRTVGRFSDPLPTVELYRPDLPGSSRRTRSAPSSVETSPILDTTHPLLNDQTILLPEDIGRARNREIFDFEEVRSNEGFWNAINQRSVDIETLDQDQGKPNSGHSTNDPDAVADSNANDFSVPQTDECQENEDSSGDVKNYDYLDEIIDSYCFDDESGGEH